MLGPFSFAGGLVVPAVQSLDEGQQVRGAEEARRSNPAAVAERGASGTRFEHLGDTQARQEAAVAFPETINEPAGGPPQLLAGQKIVGYPRDNVAQVDLGDGRHTVIESTEPMAVETALGRRKPLDLSLADGGGGFEPTTPAVSVVIPKRLSDGVRLSTVGVSLTPVDAQGGPLEGEGVVDGASVVYANTQLDSDTVAKPIPNGFETDVLLRSVDSPEELYFRVGMPVGARLVQSGQGTGPVRVVDGNVTVALISAPSARDATGMLVPVSMSVAGNKLLLRVNRSSGEYQYPIAVDPRAEDSTKRQPSNFHFIHEGSQFTAEETGSGESWRWIERIGGAHKTSEWGAYAYTTQGHSSVEWLTMEDSWPKAGAHLENSMLVVSPKGEVEAAWYNIERQAGQVNHDLKVGGVPNWNNSGEVLTESNGEGEGGEQDISKATVTITQEYLPEASFNTTYPTIAGQPNVLYGTNNWLGPKSGAFEMTASENGIGVEKLSAFANSTLLTEKNLRTSGLCAGIQCPQSVKEPVFYNSAMPNGEVKIGDLASSVMGEGEHNAMIKVDAIPPTGITVSGLGSGNEIGEGEYGLKAEATGSLAGVKTMALSVDGREVGKANGSCSGSGCIAKAEWQINGGEFGAGEHKLKVTATDNADNEGTGEITLKVHHAAPVSVGPGAVNPQSGEMTLSATDVSVASPGANLEVARDYRSRHLSAGSEGPLGPQWSLSVGGQESITKLPNGNATLTAANGGQTTFTSNSKSGFVSPPGDANLTLAEGKNAKGELTEFVLSDAANGGSTRFTSPQGPTASLWRPTTQEGPLPSQTVRYIYETSEGISRPRYALAPEPAGVTTCLSRLENKEELVAGCRALEFKYATSKTATGEGPKEWGDYIGRLKEVIFRAYNPATKAMAKTPVADYKWDKQGRLRAEWNPQVEHELKVTYGYDSENHVTAVSAPGQQPWLLHYGTIASDASTGRLLSVIRPSAATELSTASEPIIKTVPALSTTHPVIGTTVSVTNGSWSNTPLSYGYQWERCNSAGAECAAILGASNQTYTPVMADYAHALVAQITATNANGSTAAASAASSAVPIALPGYSSTFGTSGNGAGQFAQPTAAAVASNGNVWVADTSNHRLEEFSASGAFIEALGWGVSNGKEELQTCTSSCKAGTVSSLSPDGIAINHTTGEIYVADAANNRVDVFSASGELYFVFGEGFSDPHGIAIDSSGNIWVANTGADKVTEYEAPFGGLMASYGAAGKGLGQFEHPSGVAFAGGNLYVTDLENQRIQELKTSTGEWVREFGNTGSETEKVSDPSAIATDEPNGDLYVASYATGRVQAFSQEGKYVESFGKFGSEHEDLEDPAGIAINPTSGAMYVGDEGNNRVDVWAPTGPSEEPIQAPPTLGTSAVTTIDYQVPLAGGITGLATMSASEVEKWGQTNDLPAEATAIFPPDEPEGWPAKSYKRATVEYLDSKGRTVNVSAPSGGKAPSEYDISTSEYNAINDVTRTLSADNRAAALKETCESKEKCKSAELAKLLSEEDSYEEKGSEPGAELLSTLGPQHTLELTSGSEVEARTHVVYSYDEGAPSEGGPYHLVTKTIQGAEVSGKEENIRETATAYSGQEGLGWKLRKPTAVTTDPGGLDLVHKTLYNRTTGNPVESKAPAADKEVVYPPVYTGTFGTAGSGNGQFNHPESVAVDSSGNLWVSDYGNSRIEKFSSSGTFLQAYGSAGSGVDEFSNAWDVAVNQGTNNVYVADTGNNRVEELSSAGEFVAAIGWGVSDGKAELEVCKSGCKAGIAGSGNGEFNGPVALAIDSTGDIWVLDSGNNRVEELSSAGAYMTQFGSKGTGNGQLTEPTGIALDEGEIYVVDYGNDRVEEFSPSGGYLAQFGSKGSGERQFSYPVSIAVNSTSGDLYVSDAGNSRIEEFTPAGKFLTEFGSYGSGKGQLNTPTGLAVNASGEVYIADQDNARISEWLPQGTGGARMSFSSQFGSAGSGNGQFSFPVDVSVDGHGNLWVTDFNNNRVQELSSTGKFIAAYGTKGSGHGQFANPTGIGVNQSTGNVYVGDCGNSRIEELNSSGEYVRTFGSGGSEPGQFGCPDGVKVDSSGNVWVVDGEHNRIEEFSAAGTFMATYGTKGSGEGQFDEPGNLTFSGGNLYVVDAGNHRIEELSPAGKYLGQFGVEGTGSGEFLEAADIAADSAGNLYVVDGAQNRVQEFSSSGTFLARFASGGSGEGQLKGPLGIAINAAGSAYIVDSGNNRVEQWTPANEAVHNTKTIYYTAKEEAEVLTCRNHPEWAGLPCQTEPGAQPHTAELPELPVTSYTYNVWDEPETTVETIGATKRTNTDTYDAAGRLKTSTVSSTVGTALPTVTNEYNEKTGALEKQSTSSKTITSVYNTLGQLTSYTDAGENTATYEYDIDGRVKKINTGKGTETYGYNETTGFLAELLSEYGSSKLAFAATYDVEGNMLTETYPNGMTATHTYNQTGKPTNLQYVKTTHCSEKCTWFNDKIVPSAQGQWLEQTNTLQNGTTAHQAYTYDTAGRLTQIQNTPAGKGCTTRIYTYDEETNRTSLTTREPNSKNECTTEGGTVEKHTYDEANRLTDTGLSYNTFGDITALPATDAGGKEPAEELTSTYYTDNQLDTQTQNGETIGYNLDPAGRTLEIVATGKKASALTSHYDGPGATPSWTGNISEWTRNISGINGQLTAVQANGGTPVLQLANLHGDIIATASLSETATGLETATETSEYGVPTTSSPPKYSWLGAGVIATELPSGIIDMGARSYIPQLGRFLQPDPVPGGSANAYAYTFGDPVNSSDPTGEYVEGAYLYAFNNAENERSIEREAAREAAAKAAAEAAAREAAEAAARAAGPQYSEGEQEPLGGYAGWACEYAAETGQEGAGCADGDGSPLTSGASRFSACHAAKGCKAQGGSSGGGSSGGGGSHCGTGNSNWETGVVVLSDCSGEEPRPGEMPPVDPQDGPWGTPGWDPEPVPVFG
ncbi:MAG: SMP-30/gluconolactonase/LRE family protein [Solirubrobacteraceae bacterium]|jgi:RHS repeat-associated protein